MKFRVSQGIAASPARTPYGRLRKLTETFKLSPMGKSLSNQRFQFYSEKSDRTKIENCINTRFSPDTLRVCNQR